MLSFSKPWFKSKTILSLLAGAAIGVIGLAHKSIDPQTQNDTVDFLTKLGELATIGIGIYGRFNAKHAIAPLASADSVPPTKTPVLAAMLLGVVLFAGVGCTALQSPAGPYVAADRATYDAVAPDYRNYVEHDSNLTPDQVTRREQTLSTWDLRIKSGESATTQPAGSSASPQAK